jgi:hypothetical protein
MHCWGEQIKKQGRQRSASLNETCSAFLFLRYFRELHGNLSNPHCQRDSEDTISASLLSLSMRQCETAVEVKLNN